MSGQIGFGDGKRNPEANSNGVGGFDGGHGGGVPQLRAGVPKNRFGSPLVRDGSNQPFVGHFNPRQGVPQTRGFSQLGSARFVTRPPWIGPPYTQVNPPPAFMFRSSEEKSGKRKLEHSEGEILFLVHI
jgi:hypothetical protein